MTTKRKLEKAAYDLDCTIDWNLWDITAPDGYRFKATSTHSVVFQPQEVRRLFRPYYSKEAVETALRGAISDLELGLEACPADCECREEDQLCN